MNQTIEILLNHSSVRNFTDQPVSEETINTILRCAQMAPTSSFFQAYTIIRVEDPEKRQALQEFSGGQKWVTSAPLALLFCADVHRNMGILDVEDKEVFHNTESFTVSVADATFAAQKAFIAAQALGLGGVVVGGIRNNMPGIAQLFNLPDMVFPLFLLCLGYPKHKNDPKPRLPLQFICGVDQYPTIDNDQLFADYDKEILDYMHQLTQGRESFGFVDRLSFALKNKPRYEVTDFVKSKGFLKK